MKDWLLGAWNRRPGELLVKQGMLVLGMCKGCLAPEVKVTITGDSMNSETLWAYLGG
jgi:hypothetical protein